MRGFETITSGFALHPAFDISLVDFDNPDDVVSFGSLLCGVVSKSETFDDEFLPSADTLRKIARRWLREVDTVIDSMTASAAFKVTSCYDLIHRIAYHTPAFTDFLNKYTLKAFESMIRGDEAVNRYDMFRRIAAGIDRGDKAYFGRPLQWQSLCLERWYKQFSTDTGLEGLSDYDIAQRVNILLETDLWAFDPRNQSAFKHHLLNTYHPLLNATAPDPKSQVIEST